MDTGEPLGAETGEHPLVVAPRRQQRRVEAQLLEPVHCLDDFLGGFLDKDLLHAGPLGEGVVLGHYCYELDMPAARKTQRILDELNAEAYGPVLGVDYDAADECPLFVELLEIRPVADGLHPPRRRRRRVRVRYYADELVPELHGEELVGCDHPVIPVVEVREPHVVFLGRLLDRDIPGDGAAGGLYI